MCVRGRVKRMRVHRDNALTVDAVKRKDVRARARVYVCVCARERKDSLAEITQSMTASLSCTLHNDDDNKITSL